MTEFLHHVFVSNFWLKLVSVLLAAMLWAVVARDPVAEVEVRVPIEFRNVSDTLEIDSQSFTESRIRLRGPERLIHRLQPGDVRVEVDLGPVRAGSRTFDLSERNVRMPQDLDLVQIVPGQFQLSFDNRITRMIEVHPRVTGNPGPGMRIAKIVADPSSIAIVGPRHHVEAVDAASTDPVDVSGLLDRGTFVTQTSLPDPLVQVLHPTPVRVTVIMERAEEQKRKE